MASLRRALCAVPFVFLALGCSGAEGRASPYLPGTNDMSTDPVMGGDDGVGENDAATGVPGRDGGGPPSSGSKDGGMSTPPPPGTKDASVGPPPVKPDAGMPPVGGKDAGMPSGDAPTLPSPKGTCPTFTATTLTFAPAGGSRTARVWIDTNAAKTLDGPVVFYWYGTGGSPNEAQTALGDGIAKITALGGIVVAPVHANGGTFPWLSGGEADFQLADEIVACAQQKVGIDARHIHSLGFSAGGLFTTNFSFKRSTYLASVATYSGGGQGTFADPSNKFAAMIFYGGSSDNVFGQNFQSSSQQYATALRAADHFALLCNHNGGHSMPNAAAKASVTTFFLDHPYGVPSPYETSLPSSVPSVCKAN